MLSFYVCDNPNHQGKTNTWFTPKYLVEPLGEFDLDPCTQSFRPFDIAKNHYCFDLNQNGLLLQWDGRVFLNPPYGRNISLWLDKLAKHGNGIALTFISLETSWGQKHLRLSNAIYILSGRVAFVREDLTVKSNAGKGNCFFIYGKNNLDIFEKGVSLPGILLKK